MLARTGYSLVEKPLRDETCRAIGGLAGMRIFGPEHYKARLSLIWNLGRNPRSRVHVGEAASLTGACRVREPSPDFLIAIVVVEVRGSPILSEPSDGRLKRVPV